MITIVKVFKRQGTPPSKKKVFLWVLHDVPITPYAMFLKKKKSFVFSCAIRTLLGDVYRLL